MPRMATESTAIPTVAAVGVRSTSRLRQSCDDNGRTRTRAKSRYRGVRSPAEGYPLHSYSSDIWFRRRLRLRTGAERQQYRRILGTKRQPRNTSRWSNTGNGTSTPPFSLEQPAGFSAADKAGFFHDTFDPFYRDQEGAVPENTPVTLRFRTLHSSGIWGVDGARLYIRHGDGRDHRAG